MEGEGRKGLSSFSVLLIMAALSLFGVISLRQLHVQYAPSVPRRNLSVSFSYPGATAAVVEAEVTSKLEGILSGLDNVTGTSSTSSRGGGSVSVSFRKRTDMTAARFEVASQIRNLYHSLPDRVSYPWISLNSGGRSSRTAVAFLLKGAMPSLEIEKFARNQLLTPLSSIDGVDGVSISGATPFEWVITFDAQKALSAGITAGDLSGAFNRYYSSSVIGMTDDGEGVVTVRLENAASEDFAGIPVKNVGGKVIHLGDIADYRRQEALPGSYYRVNGLNTVTLSVVAGDGSNLIRVVDEVKSRMNELGGSFTDDISWSVSYDASEYVSKELDKIYFRTLLCLLILLLFVFLINRSWRYMLIIALTLATDLLIAAAVYRLTGLSIHIYTLAGITVSLGIIIDTSIVMIDHYGYYHDRRCFPSLLAAVGTTVGALLMVLLLPDSEKANLTDFIWVIAINLAVSLLVSWLFIPALMSYLPLKKSAYYTSVRRRRRVLRWNRRQERYIGWGLRHRWVYVAVFVLAFGIPLCLIPSPEQGAAPPKTAAGRLVRKIVSFKPYAENKNKVDRIAGSSFGLFHRSLDRANFYREPARQVLSIRAGMLEGCTVNQLNEVVKAMENYLAQFDQIESFITSIRSYDNAAIEVHFKPEYEHTSFPSTLKQEVTSMAIDFGGANWRVYGINESNFNNNIVTNYKSSRIQLFGYNFQELYRYAEMLVEHLSRNVRVQGPEIWGSGWGGAPVTEFNLDYDFASMLAAGADPYSYFATLQSKLYDQAIGTTFRSGEPERVVLRSSDSETFDLWHVLNAPVEAGATKITLSDVGSIEKRRTGIDIRKYNQSYEVDVCYDFIGSYELGKRTSDKAVKYMKEILPIGYKVATPGYGWSSRQRQRYLWLILLIIVVIYVMLCMTFESFRYPFAVIFMIPISFIGLFLVFGLSDFAFDQGGFAAFVMLSGIVVNAGIYLLTTFERYRTLPATSGRGGIRQYVKAFNHKINPITLTIVSTILGLLPFLSDGPEEVFWFDFAVGTIGGMGFSILALLLYLPVFALRRRPRGTIFPDEAGGAPQRRERT